MRKTTVMLAAIATLLCGCATQMTAEELAALRLKQARRQCPPETCVEVWNANQGQMPLSVERMLK